MFLQLILVITEKYVMAGPRNWTTVSYLNKTFYKRYTHVVAEIELVLWFRGWAHFCLLALITLSIFVLFTKIRCQNLSKRFFCETKHNLFTFLVSKLNNT